MSGLRGVQDFAPSWAVDPYAGTAAYAPEQEMVPMPRSQGGGESQIARGVRSAFTGAKGSLQGYAGQVAGLVGADGVAAQLNEYADQNTALAQQESPRVTSIRQIMEGGYQPRDMVDYAAGTFGQVAPYLLGGFGAGAIGRGVGLVSGMRAGLTGEALAARQATAGAVGATASYQPIMAGEQANQLRNDPAAAGMSLGEQALRSNLVGAAQAGVNAIAPTSMLNKTFNRAPIAAGGMGVAQTAGRVLAGTAQTAGLEGLGEGAEDIIGQVHRGQYDPNYQYNLEQTGEAAAAGFVGGAPVAGAHSTMTEGMDYANAGVDAAGAAGKRGWQAVKDAPYEAGKQALAAGARAAADATGVTAGMDAAGNYIDEVQKAASVTDDPVSKAGIATAKVGNDIGEAIQRVAESTMPKLNELAGGVDHRMRSDAGRVKKTLAELSVFPETDGSTDVPRELGNRAAFFDTFADALYKPNNPVHGMMKRAAQASREIGEAEDMAPEDMIDRWGVIAAAATKLRQEYGGEDHAATQRAMAKLLVTKGAKFSRVTDQSNARNANRVSTDDNRVSEALDKAFAATGHDLAEMAPERTHIQAVVRAATKQLVDGTMDDEILEIFSDYLDTTFGPQSGRLKGAIFDAVSEAKKGDEKGMATGKSSTLEFIGGNMKRKGNYNDSVKAMDVVLEGDRVADKFANRSSVKMRDLPPALADAVEAQIAVREKAGIERPADGSAELKRLVMEMHEESIDAALRGLVSGSPDPIKQRVRDMDHAVFGDSRKRAAIKAQHDEDRLNAAESESRFTEDGFSQDNDANQTALSVVADPSERQVHDTEDDGSLALPVSGHVTHKNRHQGGELGAQKIAQMDRSTPHSTTGTTGGKPARGDGGGYVEVEHTNVLEHISKMGHRWQVEMEERPDQPGVRQFRGETDDELLDRMRGEIAAKEVKNIAEIRAELKSRNVDADEYLNYLQGEYGRAQQKKKDAFATKQPWEVFDGRKMLEEKYGMDENKAQLISDLFWSEAKRDWKPESSGREFFEKFRHSFPSTRNMAGSHERMDFYDLSKGIITDRKFGKLPKDDRRVAPDTGIITVLNAEGQTVFLDLPKLMRHSLGKVRTRDEGVDELGGKEQYDDGMFNPDGSINARYASDMRAAWANFALSLIDSKDFTPTAETARLFLETPDGLLLKKGTDGAGDVTWGQLTNDTKKVEFNRKQTREIVKRGASTEGKKGLANGIMFGTAKAPITSGGEPVTVNAQALIRHTAAALGVDLKGAPKQVYYALLKEGIRTLRDSGLVDANTLPMPTNGINALNPQYAELVIGDRAYTKDAVGEDGDEITERVSNDKSSLVVLSNSSAEQSRAISVANRFDLEPGDRAAASLGGLIMALEMTLKERAPAGDPVILAKIKTLAEDLAKASDARADVMAKGFSGDKETAKLHELNAAHARLVREARAAGLELIDVAPATKGEIDRLAAQDRAEFEKNGKASSREDLNRTTAEEIIAKLRNAIAKQNELNGLEDESFVPEVDENEGRTRAQVLSKARKPDGDGPTAKAVPGHVLGKTPAEVLAIRAITGKGKTPAETVAAQGSAKIKVDPHFQRFVESITANEEGDLAPLNDNMTKAWYDAAKGIDTAAAKKAVRQLENYAKMQDVDLATGKYKAGEELSKTKQLFYAEGAKRGTAEIAVNKTDGGFDVLQNGKVVGAIPGGDAQISAALSAGTQIAASLESKGNGFVVSLTYRGAEKEMPAYDASETLTVKRQSLKLELAKKVEQGKATVFVSDNYPIHSKLSADLSRTGKVDYAEFNDVSYTATRFGEVFGADTLHALERVLQAYGTDKEPSAVDLRMLSTPRLNGIKRNGPGAAIGKFSRITLRDGRVFEGNDAEQVKKNFNLLFNADVAKFAEFLNDGAGNDVGAVTVPDPKSPRGFFATMSLQSNSMLGSNSMHEALHGLFTVLGQTEHGKGAMDKLMRSLTGGMVQARLSKVLDSLDLHVDVRTAIDKDINSSQEEAAAYAFQFWATGDLKLGNDSNGLFAKVGRFFRNLLHISQESERSEAFFTAFLRGELGKADFKKSALETAFAERHGDRMIEQIKAHAEPFMKVIHTVFDSSIRAMERISHPSATELMRKYTGYRDGEGYIKRVTIESRAAAARVQRVMEKYKSPELAEAIGEIYAGKVNSAAAKEIMAFIDEQNEYAGQAKGTLPTVWDYEKISGNRAAFDAAIADFGKKSEHAKGAAVLDILSDMGYTSPGDKTSHVEFLPQYQEERAKWIQQDFTKFMRSFITQSVKRTEHAKIFKDGDGDVKHHLDLIRKDAGEEAYGRAMDFVDGMEGRLGKSMSPAVRNLMKTALTVGNVVTLPFALFSAAVDPFHLTARSNNMGEAAKAYAGGVGSIFRTISEGFGAKHKTSAEERFAEDIGAIEHSMMTDVLGDIYLGDHAEGWTKKVNDWFFKANMLDGWTRQMRVAAVSAGQRFIIEHAEMKGQHSKRFMEELGLKPSDVVVENGNIVMNDKIRMALNQFVDESIVRPDQATNAIWMNDPRFMLLSHMKRFTFAFNDILLNRAMREMGNGNMMPLTALAASVPAIILADMSKHFLKGDFDTWGNGKTAGQWFEYGASRAGLNGKLQFGLDAVTDMEKGGTPFDSAMGPDLGLIKKALGGPVHAHAMASEGFNLIGLADTGMHAYQGTKTMQALKSKRELAAA